MGGVRTRSPPPLGARHWCVTYSPNGFLVRFEHDITPPRQKGTEYNNARKHIYIFREISCLPTNLFRSSPPFPHNVITRFYAFRPFVPLYAARPLHGFPLRHPIAFALGFTILTNAARVCIYIGGVPGYNAPNDRRIFYDLVRPGAMLGIPVDAPVSRQDIGHFHFCPVLSNTIYVM